MKSFFNFCFSVCLLSLPRIYVSWCLSSSSSSSDKFTLELLLLFDRSINLDLRGELNSVHIVFYALGGSIIKRIKMPKAADILETITIELRHPTY